MTIEDGYAIQRAWVQLEMAGGRRIKGRKIGLTSRAMQQASQITEPDYAPLMDDMFFDTGSDIPWQRFIAPRVEVELAFVLAQALRGPGVTLFQVLQATDYVTSPRWRSSMRASNNSTATPSRRARCSIPSRTSRATPASCSAAGRSNPMPWISVGGRASIQERRHRRNRPGRCGAESPGDRSGLAREQDAPATTNSSTSATSSERFFTRPTNVTRGDVPACRLWSPRQYFNAVRLTARSHSDPIVGDFRENAGKCIRSKHYATVRPQIGLWLGMADPTAAELLASGIRLAADRRRTFAQRPAQCAGAIQALHPYAAHRSFVRYRAR